MARQQYKGVGQTLILDSPAGTLRTFAARTLRLSGRLVLQQPLTGAESNVADQSEAVINRRCIWPERIYRRCSSVMPALDPKRPPLRAQPPGTLWLPPANPTDHIRHLPPLAQAAAAVRFPMPVTRKLLASDGTTYLERVSAASPGADWTQVHTATDWRCVLPGQGQVDWRNGHEAVYVDALTAFRLDPGDAYQLQHRSDRLHNVVCSSTLQVAAISHRAWLLHPRALFELRKTLAQLRRGDTGDVTHAGATVRSVLAPAFPLQPVQDSGALLRARRCIASASQRPMKLEELAEEARCSPFHLARLFRRHLGLSPHQYRLHLRLADALVRLEDAGTKLADLAFELGFSSQSHFGDVFRQAVGCTPGQARLALR